MRESVDAGAVREDARQVGGEECSRWESHWTYADHAANDSQH
jgi:hypothetical protein